MLLQTDLLALLCIVPKVARIMHGLQTTLLTMHGCHPYLQLLSYTGELKLSPLAMAFSLSQGVSCFWGEKLLAATELAMIPGCYCLTQAPMCAGRALLVQPVSSDFDMLLSRVVLETTTSQLSVRKVSLEGGNPFVCTSAEHSTSTPGLRKLF